MVGVAQGFSSNSVRLLRSYSFSESMIEASNTLAEVQAGLALRFGMRRVYVGGGSSRAMLDHVLYGNPLRMRDFDIFAVAGKKIDASYAEKIGRSLASATLGEYSAPDLRPRNRGNPHVDPEEQLTYNAGYGFFWKQPHVEVDLSIYHSDQDLELNGILDVDTIMIPVPETKTLLDVCSEILEQPNYETARQRGIVEDRFNGYAKWRSKRPTLVHPLEVKKDPVQIAIRIIRAHIKMGSGIMSDTLREDLAFEVFAQKSLNRLQTIRNFLKLLGDPTAPVELKLLEQIGIFKRWGMPIGEFVKTQSEETLSTFFEKSTPLSNKTALSRFLLLLSHVNKTDRQGLLDDLALVEPELVQSILLRQA